MKTPQTHVLIVVTTLAAHALVSLVGLMVLIGLGTSEGSLAIISGLGGISLGAIAGILSKTERTPPDPTKTEIVNSDSNPVPTTDAKNEDK